jgi:hypothetical protein
MGTLGLQSELTAVTLLLTQWIWWSLTWLHLSAPGSCQVQAVGGSTLIIDKIHVDKIAKKGKSTKVVDLVYFIGI